jgi:uncharacterized membrane protein YphA (DoxX/SURF4 family)
MKQQKLAEILLRIGLAATFAYAGFSAIVMPQAWIGFLPAFIGHIVAPSLALELFSVLEVGLAAWLLSGFWTRYAALATAVFTTGIMVVDLGALLVTFRDIAIIFAALALAVLA